MSKVLKAETAKQARDTEFARWRERCGLKITEAACLLGKSTQTVMIMDRGARYDTGQPFTPCLSTRLLMSAIAEGYRPQAWPE